MSEVYFSTARTIRWDYRHSVAGKIESLLDQLNFSGRFTKDDWVAVKTHWGSQGAFRIVHPVQDRPVIGEMALDRFTDWRLIHVGRIDRHRRE